jgi:Uma2 family endonuclease
VTSNPTPRRSPQEDLLCNYASQQIDGTFLFQPEFRLELVEGKFLVGGTLEGSRWLLKEALIGWGAEAAIAFAPLEKWWESLRISYRVNHQSPEEWLTWAENLPLQDLREGWGTPMGSQYSAEHRWTRDRLREALSHHVSQACLGKCFGPQYGMWVGDSVFTPDLMFLEDVRLAENPCYERHMQGPANLVIEIVTPERAEIDERVRRHYYERHGVAHYWTINPIAQQVQFWQNSPEGFQSRSLDPDGSYRGIPGITFTPSLLWIREERFPSLPLGLPIIASELNHRRWMLRYEESETAWGWDSLTYSPV